MLERHGAQLREGLFIKEAALQTVVKSFGKEGTLSGESMGRKEPYRSQPYRNQRSVIYCSDGECFRETKVLCIVMEA